MSERTDIPRRRSWTAAALRLLTLVVRRLLLLAACLAALGCLLLGVLQTHPAQGWILEVLGKKVLSSSGAHLSADVVSGLFPFRFKLARVALTDDDGPLLLLEEPAIDWSPLALLRGRVAIAWLGAREMHVIRWPPRGTVERGPIEFSGRLPAVEVEHIDLPRLGVSGRILGRELWVEAEGSLRFEPGSDSLQAELKAKELDGGTARFELSADYRRREARLKVSANLLEQPGGVLGAVLGLPPASGLDFELQGDGPLNGWTGRLRAEAGELVSLHATAAIPSGPTPQLQLEGVVERLRWPPGRPGGVILGPLAFRLNLTREAQGGLALDVSRLAGEGAELTGRLSCDEAWSRYGGEARLEVAELRVPAERAGAAGVEGSLRAAARFEGSRGGGLRANVEITTENARVSAFRTERATAAVVLDLPAGGLSPERLRVSGHGRLFRPLWREAPLGLAEELEWTLDEMPASAFETGPIAMRLKSGGVTLVVTASGVAAERTVTGVVELTVADLSELLLAKIVEPREDSGGVSYSLQSTAYSLSAGGARAGLRQFSGAGLRGPARFGGTLRADLAHGVLEGELTGRLSRPGQAAVAPAGVLSDTIDWSSRFRAEAQGRVEFTELEARSGRTEVRFGGGVSPDGSGLEGHWSVRAGGLTAAGSTGKPVRGQVGPGGGELALEGTVAGSVWAPRFDATIEGRELPFRQVRLERVGGRVGLECAKAGVSGQLELTASKVVGPSGSLESAEVSATVSNLMAGPSGTARVRLTGWVSGETRADEVTAELEGGVARMELKVRGRGRFGPGESRQYEFDGAAAAESPGADGLWRKLTLRRLQARVGKEPLQLAGPAELRLDGDSLEATKLAITWGKARLQGSAKLAGGKVSAAAELSNLPLARVVPAEAGASGIVSGKLRLEGAAAEPAASFELRARDVRVEEGRGRLPPIQLTASGQVAQGRLSVRGKFEGVSARPFEGELVVPVRFSLAPLEASAPAGGALTGSLKGGLELERVAKLAGLDAQKLSGKVALDLRLSGTVGAPSYEGGAEVRELFYENLVTGTVLRDGQLSAKARGRRLEIERGSASDGAQGKVAIQGWAELEPARGIPLALTITLERARVVRNDQVHAEAGGVLKLGGTALEPVLEGKLTVGPADVRIPERMPQDITMIDIEEAGTPDPPRVAAPASRAGRPAPARGPAASGVTLDLEFDLPGRVFVRGRGMESEWKGRLKLDGSPSRPGLTGALNLVRGFFSFADKRFTLVRGTIAFTGAVPPTPDLDLLAEARARGMVARLGVVGTSANPRIELSSDPAYPADEVLSRLLFGRGIASISPAQALQLAAAVQALAGGAGGGGVMGFARDLVGVDLLNVGASASGAAGTAVGFGKYLREGVYVGVEKSLGTGGSNVSVEAELTPGLTVETNVDSTSRSGVGLNWRKDY